MIITEILTIRNLETGFEGYKSISGSVNKQGAPIASFVRCYEKSSGVMVGRIVSSIDGEYRFSGLNEAYKYYVTSHDPASQFNAVIQDNVVPK